MTKVKICAGICGMVTNVTAEADDGYDLKLHIDSTCPSVQKMFEELGDEFSAFEEVMIKPGCGSFYKYASEHFPAHGGCPTISGIIKCMEAECGLALKAPVSIEFIED